MMSINLDKGFKMLKLILIFISMLLPLSFLYASTDEIRPGVILYKTKDGATPSELKSLNALLNSKVHSEVVIDGINLHIATLRAKGIEVSTSKLLMDTGAVKFSEPDRAISPTLTPNDTLFSLQWHHEKISSTTAWDSITSPNDTSEVKVCVLDTGVDLDHPDLVENLLPGYNANGLDSVQDVHGHGTGTAGVIGATGNNGIGVSGVLWDIDILPVQINIANVPDDPNDPDDCPSCAYISTMATGIQYCADQGAKVANLSYGGAQYATIDEAATYLRDRGGLLFMSAGNDGTSHDVTSYPDWESFVIVGATEDNDTKSDFSEYGLYVDIVAPGSRIATTGIDENGNAGYYYMSGTSFSSPMAAGLGALVYAVNPSFTPAQVEAFLFDSAVDLGETGEDDFYGKGRIDAASAISLALDYMNVPNEVPIAIASSTNLNDYVPLDVHFDGSGSSDDGTIVSYQWDFGDGNNVEGIDVVHTYNAVGIYNAILTVTDDHGAIGHSTPVVITVEADSSVVLAPSGLSASVNSNTIVLNWNDNSSNETGFVIERAKKTRGKYNYVPLTTTGLDVTSYEDIVAETGDYKYRIQAVNDTSVSDYSSELLVKVESIATDPEPEPEPGTLTAPTLSHSISGTDVTLIWSASCSDNSCSYVIERGDTKVKGNINFTEVSRVDIFSNTEIFNETSGTFYYRVKAQDDKGTVSDYSNTVSVRIK